MSKEYTRRISVLGNVPSHGPFSFFDDFENLLKWSKQEGIGDSIFELDPTIANSGNQSLYMKTRTTNAAEDDFIGARIQAYMTPSLKLNQAMHFRSPDFTKIKTLRFFFTLDDGTTVHDALLQFLPNTPKWQYYDVDGVPQDIPDATILLVPNAWNRLQLLANIRSNEYIKTIINSAEYDLSGIEFLHSNTGTHLYMQMDVRFYTIGAAPAELYIDDFLLHEL